MGRRSLQGNTPLVIELLHQLNHAGASRDLLMPKANASAAELKRYDSGSSFWLAVLAGLTCRIQWLLK